MKIIFHCIICVLLLTPVYSQNSPKNNKRKNYFILIDDASFANSKPERGACLKAHYKNDTLQNIETWFGFNFGDLKRDFFYWNNQLIVVTEIQKLYSSQHGSPINTDSIKPNFTARYLFSDTVLTDVIQKGSYNFMDSPADKNTMQATLFNLSEQYVSVLDERRADKKNRLKDRSKRSRKI